MISPISFLQRIKPFHAIFAALILGAFFGAYFNVSKYKIAVTYLEGNQEQVELVENWQKIDLVLPSTGEVVASFGKEEQLKLLNYYNGLKKSEREGLVVSATEFPEFFWWNEPRAILCGDARNDVDCLQHRIRCSGTSRQHGML